MYNPKHYSTYRKPKKCSYLFVVEVLSLVFVVVGLIIVVVLYVMFGNIDFCQAKPPRVRPRWLTVDQLF